MFSFQKCGWSSKRQISYDVQSCWLLFVEIINNIQVLKRNKDKSIMFVGKYEYGYDHYRSINGETEWSWNFLEACTGFFFLLSVIHGVTFWVKHKCDKIENCTLTNPKFILSRQKKHQGPQLIVLFDELSTEIDILIRSSIQILTELNNA